MAEVDLLTLAVSLTNRALGWDTPAAAESAPPPPSSPAPEPDEAAREAAALDALARKAGLLIARSGALYGCSPTPQHEVLVEREGDRWTAWAGWYPWRRGGEGGAQHPAREWHLYGGPDLQRALRAAVTFAEGARRRGGTG